MSTIILAGGIGGVLIFAFGPETRSTEGRIVGQRYAPCQEGSPDDIILRPLCGDFVEEEAPNAESVASGTRSGEQATETLSESESVPRSAVEFSNEAALELRRAQLEQDPLILFHAHEIAERAVQADPELPEARFNLALIQEHLVLSNATRQSWERYLELDSTSKWADEARARLRRLSENRADLWQVARKKLFEAALAGDGKQVTELLDPWRQETREELELSVLPSWGSAWLAGKEVEANRWLTIARVVSSALATPTRDALADPELAAAVSVLDSAARSDRALLTRLAEGHVWLDHGLALFARGRSEEAAAALAQSERVLASAGSPWSGRAMYQRARIAYKVGAPEVRNLLVATLAEARRATAPDREANAHWRLGLVAMNRGDVARGLAHFSSAAEIFARLGRRADRADVDCNRLSSLAMIGAIETDEHAVGEWLRALRSLARAAPDRYRVHIADFAKAAAEREAVSVARAAAREETVAAQRKGDSYALAVALLHQARIAAQTGDDTGAKLVRAQAAQAGQEIAEPSYRDFFEIDLFSDTARAHREAHAWESAREAADHAVALAERHGVDLALPRLLSGRATARAELGDRAGAERDFDVAVATLDRQERSWQSTAASIEEAIGFADSMREVVRDRVAFALDVLDDPRRALAWSEAGHARLLAEHLRGTLARRNLAEVESLGLPEIQARLPPTARALFYASLGDRWVAWLVGRDHFAVHAFELSGHELTEARTAFTAARLEDPATTARAERAARDLFVRLVGPFGSELAEASAALAPRGGLDLLIVPEGPLFGVPFAGLTDPATGRRLVEDVASITLAPSFGVAFGLERRPRFEHGAAALVVDEPTVEGRRHLVESSEADEFSRAFPGAVTLAGAEATVGSVVNQLGQAQVFHFRGHGASSERSAFASRLFFARDARDLEAPAELTAADLFREPPRDLRLAVLAACVTAGVRPSASEGATGFAWPLLARGTREVVASAWAVDDADSARLFATFYREIAAGNAPAKALARAQRAALREPDRRTPFDVAAFQHFGAIEAGK